MTLLVGIFHLAGGQMMHVRWQSEPRSLVFGEGIGMARTRPQSQLHGAWEAVSSALYVVFVAGALKNIFLT